MMLYDFSLLDQQEQIDLLYKEGSYIGKRRQSSYTLVLYQLDGFYVEVIYRKYRRFVYRIHAFNSVSGIEPYLQHIDVQELVKCD